MTDADTGLGELLRSATTLLATLDRSDAAYGEARQQVAAWSRQHPQIQARLVSTRSPGSTRTEHDLYLTWRDGMTIGVTVCTDDSTPWLVSYADHWAANFVVTVNDRHVTVQEALRQLSLLAPEGSVAAQDLVDYTLESEAITEIDPQIEPAELQSEVDALRCAHGLYTVYDTEQWLAARGMARTDLGQLAASAILARRVRTTIGDAGRDAYFRAHPDAFARLTITTATCPDEEVARGLGIEARRSGLATVLQRQLGAAVDAKTDWTRATRFALDCDARLRAARSGDIIGPVHGDRGWWIASVDCRLEPMLDDDTLRRSSHEAFRTWIADRRRQASISWHWE